MRRILLIATLCLLAVASCGCKKARLRAQLNGMINHTLIIPEKILCVYKGEVFSMADSVRKKAKMVVYVDSAECHTCKLSQLFLYDRLYHLADETEKFELVYMLGNTHWGRISLVQYLLDQDLAFPVYVDEKGVLLSNNPLVPIDNKFHSFFLDSNNRIVFVGDPIFNEEIMQMLIRTVESTIYISN